MTSVAPMRNVLTFDIEEYFQAEVFSALISPEDWRRYPSRVVESTLRLLDLLEVHRASATFFVLGWIADRHGPLLRQIRERGHELACHGYAHRPIYAMSPKEFRSDIRRAKLAIEDAAGVAVLGYRAPTFSVVRETMWALDVVAEEGFRYDSSIFPIHHDRYGIPDAPRFPHWIRLAGGGEIVEVPITTLRLGGQRLPFSGGGYFRLAPYPVIRAAIRHVNRRERMPVVVYLHPWEIDPEQPRLPVRGLSRFRHYVNLRHTTGKLERLLGDFPFTGAGQALDEARLFAVTP